MKATRSKAINFKGEDKEAMTGIRIDALQFSKWSRERLLEWRKGGLDVVHVTLATWETARETLAIAGEWERLFKENKDLILQVRSTSDIHRAKSEGLTGVIFGFQNTSPFEDDLDLINGFYSAGVRIAQLTYNIQNSVGSGCLEPSDSGLSGHYGVNLVREMNRAGMLIDLSHCGDRTCLDAIEASEAPVAITHANPYEYVGDTVELAERNRSTEVINELISAGGVLGLSMYPKLAPGGSNGTIRDFCEMVAWSAERFGAENLGIGTDLYLGHGRESVLWWRTGRWGREPIRPFTGMPVFPSWMSSPEKFSTLAPALLEIGFSEKEVDGILGDNWVRLFDSVWVKD